MSDKLTTEIFLKDVSNHEMQIICDQGNTRNIRFMAPGNSNMYFDLTTWSDHLCISGDMGTYVFQRTEDMFRFFRNKEGELRINTSYWHEKLQSNSIFEGAKEFSSELFDKEIKETFDDYCKDNEVSDDFKESCWEEIKDELLYPENEWDARSKIENWYPRYDEETENFAEHLREHFGETNLENYTYHFYWILHAIVWGIQKYDQFKGEK